MMHPDPPPAFAWSSERTRPVFSPGLRAYVLTGGIVTAPISITIFLVWSFLNFLDSRVGRLIAERCNPETYLPFGPPVSGSWWCSPS